MSTLLTLGRTEEGLEQARQLANIDPVDHTTRRWVADLFLAAKEPFAQEGIDQLSVLFDQFPEDLKLAKQLSAALARRGEIEPAWRSSFATYRRFRAWMLATNGQAAPGTSPRHLRRRISHQSRLVS